MRLSADIYKKIDNFCLDIKIESNAKRIGILGASGSGKSMTLRSIAGIENPDKGHIEIDGDVLYDSSKRIDLKPQKRNVGYMFQNYALFPTMTVLQNVLCGLKGSKEENLEKAMAMISRMGINGLENRLPGELSGGQQQRVALARIMVYNPRVILLDEPFSALDIYLRDKMQREMFELLEDYNGQTLMVSHSRDELYRFSEEIFVVGNGKIIQSGKTDSIFNSPINVAIAKLTGCKNFAKIQVVNPHRINIPDWGVTLDLTREIPNDITWIGYRAHMFEPVWGDKIPNCIKVRLIAKDELPFETNLYFAPEECDKGSKVDDICWFIQGEMRKNIEQKGMPDYLKISEEKILLLKE